MNHKRIIKGNFTTVPTGSALLSAYETYAVTEKKEPSPFSSKLKSPSLESAIEARIFSEENQK